MHVTATISPNEIAARHTFYTESDQRLTVDCPNGWDDVKKLTKKVLRFDGHAYTFIGWNSDRNECFFRLTNSVAKISSK